MEDKSLLNKIGEIFKKAWDFIKSKKLLFIIISIVLVLAIVAAIVVPMLTSNSNDGDDTSDRPNGDTLYTVNIKSNGGMPLSNLDVYIYADDTLGDIVD